MEANIEKQCSALGGLFQCIINDMKGSMPVWEDFLMKTTKLHSTLRQTIMAAGMFLEAFQKVADIATSSRGATREIGSALTRLCMRHKSIETKLKAFNSSLLDLLVNPMQEKMEEWKKNVVQLDKDHAKEYKKARSEIKKASTDTVKLQKKVKKGKCNIQNQLDSAMQEVTDKYLLLEETEKNAVRGALIEERSRFCLFISYLKPVVDEEINMLTEVTHLQEILQQLCLGAGDPYALPASSEQVIRDLKGTDGHTWSFQTPPSSPSSIGSRKSSMCSISSINSSSSGSTQSHSPSHHYNRNRPNSQPVVGTVRLSSVSSQDSGFTSQDTLFMKPTGGTTKTKTADQNSVNDDSGSGTSTDIDSNASTPSEPFAGPPTTSASTWTNWPDPPTGMHKHHAKPQDDFERPHTISTAYEKTHSRPAITSQTFEPPDKSQTAPATPSPYAVPCIVPPPKMGPQQKTPTHKIYDQAKIYDRPPTGPKRAAGRAAMLASVPDYNAQQPDQSKTANVIPQPMYVNMNDLATMAVQKQKEVMQKMGMTPHNEEDEDEAKSEEGQKGQHHPRWINRSCSMPAKTQDVSPLARVIEELNQTTAALRARRSTGDGDEDAEEEVVQSKAPNSTELADAIAELEASTAALQQVYDASQPSLPGGTATIRRGSLTKPPPPVRRSSSTVGSMAVPVALPMVPNSAGTGPNTPQTTPQRPRRASSADGRRDHGSPQLPQHAAARQQSAPQYNIRPQSGDYGSPSHYMQSPVHQQYQQQQKQQQRVRVSGSPAPQQAPPPQPIYAVPQIQPQTVVQEQANHSQYASLQHQVIQQAPLPSHYMQLPVVNSGAAAAGTNGGPTTKFMIGNPDSDDDDPNWPPPPPPEYMTVDGVETGSSSTDGGQQQPHRGSVQESHASIIQSLNAKFAARQQTHNTSLPLEHPVSSGSSPRPNSQSSDDITPTAENQAEVGMLNQIQRGVKLRKTVSNDRFAPKLT